MQTLLSVMILLDVVMTSLFGLVLWHVLHRLDLVCDHLRSLMKPAESLAVRAAGGRPWPTQDELQAARNRIDRDGTAQPGGPN